MFDSRRNSGTRPGRSNPVVIESGRSYENACILAPLLDIMMQVHILLNKLWHAFPQQK